MTDSSLHAKDALRVLLFPTPRLHYHSGSLTPPQIWQTKHHSPPHISKLPNYLIDQNQKRIETRKSKSNICKNQHTNAVSSSICKNQHMFSLHLPNQFQPPKQWQGTEIIYLQISSRSSRDTSLEEKSFKWQPNFSFVHKDLNLCFLFFIVFFFYFFFNF